MSSARQYYERIFESLRKHHEWFRKVIPLIASENVPSPAVKEALITDFGNRYAEGWPGERVYAGCIYIDEVELLCIDLAKKLFRAEFVDVRPISGVCANLITYTAFTRPGDVIMARSIPAGGHISMGPLRGKTGALIAGTAGAVHGLEVEYLPFNAEELAVDPDKTREKLKRLASEGRAPKLVMFGASVFPFPAPVKELADDIHDVGAVIAYDAAHVAGLIAGGQFQDPLREGVDVMTCSTHKTLPGPQGGMVISWEKYAEDIKRATFPSNVSNHHLHHVAGKAVVLAEMLEFGREYASQVVRNAKALGQALYERGLKVLAEHKGFTQSHVLLVDITEYGDGATIEKKLERANIILNRNLLPWDIRMGRHFEAPGGIRLGAQEVTRLGMRESEMDEIAEFIKRVVVDGEDPEKVGEDVAEFRRDYQKVHYAFETLRDAYEYIEIRR